MYRKLLRYEAFLIALAPLFGYLILSQYYSAMEDKYDINLMLGSPNLMSSISLGLTIAMFLGVSFALSSWLANLVPAKNSPWFWRIKRIVQVLLFVWFALYFGVVAGKDFPIGEIYLGIGILTLPLVIALAFMEFAWPLIKHRKIKSKARRLTKETKNEVYYTSSSYAKHLFKGSRIVLLLIPLVLALLIANNRGSTAGDITKPRDYAIIQRASDDKQKQIVLIDYGTSWLVAKYDDSYPEMPAYRKEYQLIPRDDMSDYIIKTKYITRLYVYND